MKVGDLVKKRESIMFDACSNVGIVIAIGPESNNQHVRVRWSGDYGIFWTTINALELISESR